MQLFHQLSPHGQAFVDFFEQVPDALPGVLLELQAYAVSSAGLQLTEASEGERLKAYQDCRGRWTIGYGHTGPGVVPGLTITLDQADSLLVSDLHTAETFVNTHVKVPLTQNQFDALVDFAFNAGCAALLTSTLLHKLNAADYDGAAAEFAHWDHADGRVVEGLTKRRAAEAALFRKA